MSLKEWIALILIALALIILSGLESFLETLI